MKKLLLIFLIPIFSFTQNGDTNGDGFINLEDLFNVLENWLQNVNENDPEAISNLDEMTNLVDSLITLSNNISTHDIRFPQGYAGEYINWDFDSGDYSVPTDSILYVTNIFGVGGDVYMYGENGINLRLLSFELNEDSNIDSPIILAADQSITRGGSCEIGTNNCGGFNAILMPVNNNVNPILIVNGGVGQSDYMVEEGKSLYINTWYDSAVIDPLQEPIFTAQWTNWNLHNPILVQYPYKVRMYGDGGFNGYLVDEDYFSSVSNNSSESNSGTNENINDGVNIGDILTWDGSNWNVIESGEEGSVLIVGPYGIPNWSDGPLGGITVGSELYGGIVGMIFSEGEPGYVEGETHGIIFNVDSDFSQINAQEWGCWENFTGADGHGIGNGSINTYTIMNNCTDSTAPMLCDTFENEGHTDWFLPSLYELTSIMSNNDAFDGIINFDNNIWYWTSSEENVYNAWKVKYDPFGYFNSSNNVTYSSKLDNHLVLPCRYF